MLYSILHYSTTLCPRRKFWYLNTYSFHSILARPGRGRGLEASSSTSNRVNSKGFKDPKKGELCYIVL